jgi:hypothetical protein
MTCYFGEPWYELLAQEGIRVEAPVGESCLHCGEAIVAGESGELTTLVTAHGGQVVPLHDCCAVRMRIGSVGHQLGRCSCVGGSEDDPPGLSVRQAAEAAFSLWQQRPDARFN